MLEAKIKELLLNFKKTDKKIKTALIIGIVGMLLLGLSEAAPREKKTESAETQSYSELCTELEERTERIISSIDGAGNCKVMITLKNSNESVYAKNSQENGSDGNYSRDSEYVLYDGENGESPVLIKEYYPEVRGVVVVCSGADNVAVRENVINCISALYGIPTTKISVIKFNG